MGKSRSFSELVIELISSADEVASCAKDWETTDSQSLSEFAIFVEKLSSILNTINHNKLIVDTPSIRSAIESLETEIHRARAFFEMGPATMNPIKHVQDVTHDLGRSLGLLLFASIGVSLDLKEKIGVLHKEMMNAKFDGSSPTSSCYCSSFEREDEIQEVGIDQRFEIEDVALQLKYGQDEDFKSALVGLESLIAEKVVNSDWIFEEDIILILLNRLGSNKCIERLRIIKLLRNMACGNDQSKEKMADMHSLTTLVKSLARDEMERREAVGLLRELSIISSVRRRIGRIQGCIVMLVAILNGEDSVASNDAANLLNVLSSNTQNALLMAESGYFHPLIQHLRQGSEMSKILMATSLSRMVLREKTRVLLGQAGAIEPLINMFKSGKLEAKLSALNALQNLSASTQNVSLIIESGILAPILQLLFSVTSSLIVLREPASAILAKIAESESILQHKDLPDQLLSLLNMSNPKVKHHLLLALNNIGSHTSGNEVRRTMTQNGAIPLLLPFLAESDTKIRLAALNLLYTISQDLSVEFTKVGGGDYLQTIFGIISSSSSDDEIAAAVGVLSNIPVTDKKTTDKLRRADMLPILVSLISCSTTISSTQIMPWLEESVAGVFIRFTLPSNKKLQVYAAESGVIPMLVKLLSKGSIKAKSLAATSLTQFSQNSVSLRRPTKSRWACVHISRDAFCEVHDGYCTTKGSFCLLKAGAISPLIQVLKGEEREADEAVLSALATILQDNVWEKGSNCIANISGGVEAIVRVVELGTNEAKEKALWILERIFQVEDHKNQYGNSAQMALIDLAQNGEPMLRPAVAKLLAQLDLLQDQSTYF